MQRRSGECFDLHANFTALTRRVQRKQHWHLRRAGLVFSDGAIAPLKTSVPASTPTLSARRHLIPRRLIEAQQPRAYDRM